MNVSISRVKTARLIRHIHAGTEILLAGEPMLNSRFSYRTATTAIITKDAKIGDREIEIEQVDVKSKLVSTQWQVAVKGLVYGKEAWVNICGKCDD